VEASQYLSSENEQGILIAETLFSISCQLQLKADMGYSATKVNEFCCTELANIGHIDQYLPKLADITAYLEF
jgi:hypothetical protein